MPSEELESRTRRGREEGAVLHSSSGPGSISRDLHGYDARNHAIAEGIDAPAYKMDVVETFVFGSFGLILSEAVEVSDVQP